jgi:hypothetical protein
MKDPAVHAAFYFCERVNDQKQLQQIRFMAESSQKRN